MNGEQTKELPQQLLKQIVNLMTKLGNMEGVTAESASISTSKNIVANKLVFTYQLLIKDKPIVIVDFVDPRTKAEIKAAAEEQKQAVIDETDSMKTELDEVITLVS